MIEAGVASSEHDAAGKISEETGESSEAVRSRIRRGKSEVGQLDQPTPTPSDHTESEGNQDEMNEIKHGGKREGRDGKV